MDNYRIIEVRDKKSRKEFLFLPVRLYKHEKNWIRPLDQDIEMVFDPNKNKFFRNGECIRWILQNAKSETIGRIAAFYTDKLIKDKDQPTGGIGFFECLDDQEAANRLFDQAKKWLKGKGMEAMDGPINFGERNRWWGLLVDGFVEPSYCMAFNFIYYRNLFEKYGFQKYYEQYTYHRFIYKNLNPLFREKAERIAKNPRYHIKHLEMNKLEKHAEDFRIIYNKAWVKHSGTYEFTRAHAKALIDSMISIIDPKLLWFTYFDDEPVAFFLALPEINQIIKFLNGKMNLYGKLLFKYHQYRKTVNKAFALLYGVIPEHQGRGIEGAMTLAVAEVAWDPSFQYKEMEFSWIGDFNPTMIKLLDQLGATVCKTHITYRYLFDREKEVKPPPKL